MKPQVFALSAVGMLFAVSASSSAPSEAQQYARRAYAKAKVLLRAAGLGASATAASVYARVDRGGALVGVRVMRSSGSPDIDQALKVVLRRILAIYPPSGLTDGAVMLRIGRDPGIA
ncbi:MAG: hypothetical protein ACXWKR_17820, partial [Phenylobacterium sp.]